jgi:predicted RND superfamily exporter protein
MRFLPLLALQRPLSAALCVVVLASLAVAGLLRLGFDDGMESAFAGQTQAFLDFSVNRERFTPAEGDIAVSIRAGSQLTGTQLEAVRGFTLDAAFAPHVDSTVSVFALRTPPLPGSPSQPLLPLDLAGADDLAALLAAARDHPLGGDRLVSEDLSQLLVLVTLRPGEADLESARETITELEALAGDLSNADQDLGVAITGMVPIRQIVIDGLLRDLLVLNAIGIGIGSLICVIALRSVMLSLLTGLPAALALLWVLGAMGWLGLEINTVTNAIPVLILVLALCDSLHLTYEVRRQAPLHDDLADAIREAAVRVAPACALTSFTTAIAFAALLISPSELVRSLGWSGVAATLISLLAVLLAHPLVFLGAHHVPILSRQLDALLSRPPARAFTAFQGHGLWRFAMRRPRPVAAVSLVVLIAALGLFSQARPEYTFLENVSSQNEAFQALRQVDDAMTQRRPLICLSASPEKTTFNVLQTSSMPHELPFPMAKSRPCWISRPGLACTIESAGLENLETVLDRLSPTQRLRYVSSDDAWALVRLYVPDEGAQATQTLLDRLQQSLTEAGVPTNANGRPTGLLAMSSTSSLTMIGHLNISFTVAVLAAGLFVAVWFGSALYGLVALVPNILPIVCVGAWLFLSGNGLQFSSAIALTIAFGIAVDDTVHVLNRLRLTAPRDRPFDPQSVRQVFADLAPVLVTTTVVLAFGMLGSQFSAVPTIAYFGLLCIAVFALALIAVLVVLPAVMLARLGAPPIKETT